MPFGLKEVVALDRLLPPTVPAIDRFHHTVMYQYLGTYVDKG